MNNTLLVIFVTFFSETTSADLNEAHDNELETIQMPIIDQYLIILIQERKVWRLEDSSLGLITDYHIERGNHI